MTPSSCSIFGEISWCIMSCSDEIITEERYQQLSRALKQKRPDYAKRYDKVIFHDNARLHVAKPETLNWNVLSYPPYSPDIPFVASIFTKISKISRALKDVFVEP